MLRPLLTAALTLLLAGAAQASPAADETPARADPAFAAACRREAGALLQEKRLEFDRPVHSLREGAPMVRIAIRLPGQKRDAEDVLEVSCVRDPASGIVSAAVVDAAADEIGPRVIVIRGPVESMRPRPQPPVAEIPPVSINGDALLWGLYPRSALYSGRFLFVTRTHPRPPFWQPFSARASVPLLVKPMAKARGGFWAPMPAPSVAPFVDGLSNRGFIR